MLKHAGLLGLFLMVLLICNVILSTTNVDYMSQLLLLGHISTIELISFLFCSYKLNQYRLNFSIIFILVLFLFHFGQLMLFTYFRDIYSHIRFLLLMNEQEAVYGFRMMNYTFSAICMGILWNESRIKPVVTKRVSTYNQSCNWLSIAKTIIYATFIVKFSLDITTLFVSFTAGGVAARIWVNTFPNILLYYGKISLVGFALWIFALKQEPKKQLRIFIFIEVYILIMMLSGIRSENVGYLVVFLFIYIASRQKPVKLKSSILYVVTGFLTLSFIVTVGKFRTASNKSMDLLFTVWESLYKENNVILGLFDTCGDTGYTSHAVIHNYLPHHQASYGASYYKGIAAVVPNILPSVIDFGRITEESSFPIILQKSGSLSHSYENIGGSLIGEFFFNFDLLGGVFVALFFGLFIGWVSRNSSYCFITNNYYSLVLYIPIMFATIYWVRDYFGGGVREAVWGILFAYYIVKRKKRIA